MQTQLTAAVKKAPGSPFVRVKPGVSGAALSGGSVEPARRPKPRPHQGNRKRATAAGCGEARGGDDAGGEGEASPRTWRCAGRSVATSVALAETPSENASPSEGAEERESAETPEEPESGSLSLKRARQRWLRVACWKATERTGIRRSRMKKDDRLATTEMRARPQGRERRTRRRGADQAGRNRRWQIPIPRLLGRSGCQGRTAWRPQPATRPRRERGAGELACRRRYRGNAGSAGPQDHLAHRRGHRDLEGQAPGRGLHVRQIADAAVRRRLIHGEPNEAWRVMRAALATEGKERLRAGQRPRVRPAGSGLYALARRPPDSDLERAEFVLARLGVPCASERWPLWSSAWRT